MKIARKGFVLLLVLAAALFIVFLGTGHQLGARPASSLVPLGQKPDVQFVNANEIRFGYLEMGVGPLVLMFHGYPETARSWNALQTKIAEAGYRTVEVVQKQGYVCIDVCDNGSGISQSDRGRGPGLQKRTRREPPITLVRPSRRERRAGSLPAAFA